MEKLKSLEFDKNINNKLLCLNFISVVPPIALFEPGEKFQIRITGVHFAFVEVIYKKKCTFDELVSAGYQYVDAGLDEKQYYDYLCDKYSKKKWWNGKDTLFWVVFFKKITQLNLFDNNENLIPQ